MSGTRTLATVSAAASLLMVGVGMIVAILPQRVLELSGSMQAVSYLAAVFAVSYLMLQLPLGSLADRFGAKPFLVFGYLLCAVSGLVFFAAGSVATTLLGRFVQGAGEASVWALGPALLAIAYPHARGRMIGIYNAAIHAGLAVGPVLGIALFAGRRETGSCILFAGLSLCGAVAVAVLLPRPARPTRSGARRRTELRDLGRFLTQRGPQLVLTGVTLYGAGYGMFVSVLPAYLHQVKGFEAASTGALFTVFYVAIGVSQLIVGPLSDRNGRRPYMLAGLVLSAAGFGAFPLIDFPWIYLPLTGASFGLGVFCVSSMAYLNDHVADSLKGSVSGSYFLSWGVGYFAGPLAVARLAEASSPDTGYVLFAVLLAAQSILLRLFLRPDRKHL